MGVLHKSFDHTQSLSFCGFSCKDIDWNVLLQLDFKLFDYDPEHIFKVLKIDN